MTFLKLCQAFVSEHGLAGGSGPSSVLNQTGELKNVVRWICDAELYINNLWHTWDFLWFEHTETIASGHPLGPSFTVRQWDKTSFFINHGAENQQELSFERWDRFRALVPGVGDPQIVTVRPDRALRIDPPAAASVTFRGEGWMLPTKMAVGTDLPSFPDTWDRLILARAAIMYGNREDAPEIISGAEAEYVDLLEKMESAHLSGFEKDRSSTYEDEEAGAIPGFQ